MSFLSKFTGNKSADSFVDQAVDKAAAVAKKKVKETLNAKKPETDKTGGTGGLSPSSEEKDKKPKETSGGGLVDDNKAEKPKEKSGGGASDAGGSKAADSSGGDSNFNDALDDLANEFSVK